MTAGQGAAGLRDGGSREQHAQTVTREKILPRPNTERTGANRTKNKREIWHLPKRHPIKPAALSGEQGSSRDLQAPHSTQEEPIPPPTGNGESRYGQRHTDRAWQRMGELSADETNLLSPSPGIRNVALPWQPPPRHVWHSVKAAGAPCLHPPGQEDRLQDLVTSTPDPLAPSPTPFFHPTPHGTCCSELRSASWLSSPARSQWCQVGFLLLPAAAPSISAPLVERELSEVCTAIFSLHQTHCSSPCRVSYHGELAI